MKIVELHNKAMELADEADFQIRMGNLKKAKKLYAKAYVFEKKAYTIAAYKHVDEFSEAVLIKSAAFLAFDAELFDESEKMAKLALSKILPKDMVIEVKKLLNNIHTTRSFERRNRLIDNKILVHLAGRIEHQNKARKGDIEDRVNVLTKFTAREAGRKKNAPYRQFGQPSKDIKEICAYNHSIERGTSHAVIVRLSKIEAACSAPDNQA